MGKISINLTDSDKQALQQEAKKQKSHYQNFVVNVF